jgi:hypothetical protein
MGRRMADQQREMRRLYPGFRLVQDVGLWAAWEGYLRPNMRRYKVRVVYFPWRAMDDFVIKNHAVTVTVLDPVIGLGRRPPHVYSNEADPSMPRLCLFDPAADEWSPAQLIARTILPWTAEWLFCFEGWEATGEWVCNPADGLRQGSEDQLEPALIAAFHRLGRRTGSSASSALMAAASEGSFPPRFWPALSSDFSAANQPGPISTSSWAPPLVGSLRSVSRAA